MTPILTAPAGVQYITGVRPGVTGVQPRSNHEIGRGAPNPTRNGVEVSALKSDWGALQAHETG